jgi:hypothetical protein
MLFDSRNASKANCISRSMSVPASTLRCVAVPICAFLGLFLLASIVAAQNTPYGGATYITQMMPCGSAFGVARNSPAGWTVGACADSGIWVALDNGQYWRLLASDACPSAGSVAVGTAGSQKIIICHIKKEDVSIPADTFSFSLYVHIYISFFFVFFLG